ncbi:MAG: signal recognition particle-docking protein FtsY [Oscillospiraceae bacterium]|nr:signal recognition particle-docking protein FtsY [Oscillospiraceae bacterium]
MGIFAKIRDGLKKTRNSVIKGLRKLLGSFTKIDEELFEQLEETMIMGDMGAETAIEICDRLRDRVKERGITDPNDIMGLIQEITSEMLGEDEELNLSTQPSVILVIGVNGAGKTTTIGKLCHQFKQEGKRVIVAAADTFRAAAIDQLAVWTDRAGVELVRHAEGSDPAAVVFDGITAAKARQCDVLICDTAGRLHNKKNLMQELAKINRIIDREAEGCAKECLLVLDATTGQNAVNQARLFQEVAPITGIVLTKLDGTAKGGIVISIRNELGIPVKLIGVGEGIDDLQKFEARSFVDALFDREADSEEAAPAQTAETAEAAAEQPESAEPVYPDAQSFAGNAEADISTEEITPDDDIALAAEQYEDVLTVQAEPEAEAEAAPEPVSEPVYAEVPQPEENALPDAADAPAEQPEMPAEEPAAADELPAEESAEQPAEQEAEEPKKRGLFGFFRRKK